MLHLFDGSTCIIFDFNGTLFWDSQLHYDAWRDFSKILRGYEFTDEEIRFIKTDALIDFLIYNKMDKKPILAIEVDGFKYHKQNSKQIERDQIKNTILEKTRLPLLRLSTTGANEEEQIKNKIKEIID